MTSEIQIESYLTALRLHLGPLAIAEREEIVREIGAHIRDSAEESGASVDTVLARLGPADSIAAQYRDGLLIRQASRSHSPFVLLRGALRLATRGIFGVFVSLAAVFGYLMGGGLVLTAFLKPIFPANTGLWFNDEQFITSGTLFPAPPPPAHEILGMWYIPIALTIGSLTILLTSYLIRTSLGLSQRWQAKL